MVRLAVSRWIVVGACLVVYAVTSTNSQFSLTASPSTSSPGNLLCPGTVTFTCSANEVANLGTAIRWFFNDNATQLFPYLYFMSHTFPRTILDDGTFSVVVQSAMLSATPDILNAVITLTANSSVFVNMNVRRLSCGREVDNVVQHFDIAGVDNRSLNLEPRWVVCYQDNQVQEIQLTFSQIYDQFNCDFKSSNASITTSGTIEVVSDSCLRDNDTTCLYRVTDVSPGDSVQVSVFNSVGSVNNAYTVPSPTFNVTYAVNDTDCTVIVQCVSNNSQEGRVDCDISIPDAQSSNRSLFRVVANMVYNIEASYGSTNNSVVKIRQTFMTGSCGPGDGGSGGGGSGGGGNSGGNRGGAIGGGIGGTISVVVAVVVLMIIIITVTSKKRRKCGTCAIKKTEEGGVKYSQHKEQGAVPELYYEEAEQAIAMQQNMEEYEEETKQAEYEKTADQEKEQDKDNDGDKKLTPQNDGPDENGFYYAREK